MTTQELIEQGVWEAIEASQPGLAQAITDLLQVGQTPAQIGAHVAGITPSALLCYSIESAAYHRRRMLQSDRSDECTQKS